ncbi:MAG: dihydrofolate reductase, partial [Thermaurantiacus sp.]
VTVVHDLAEAVAAAGLDPRARAPTICIIGGAEIYALAMPVTTAIELTRVDIDVDGDAVFPEPQPDIWREVWREAHAAEGARPGFSFIRLERRG